MNNTKLTIYNFKNEYHWLSNMYTHGAIIDDGIYYYSVESYYQAQKSTKLGVRYQISKLPPYDAKTVGNGVKLREDWQDVKDDVMKKGLAYKFSIPSFKNLLINTGTKELIHGVNHSDEYWGFSFKTQKGLNKLGVFINEIRTKLYEDIESREYVVNELPALKRILSLFESEHDKAVVLYLQNEYVLKNALYREVDDEVSKLSDENVKTILDGKSSLVPLSATLKEMLDNYQHFLNQNKTVTIY